ncbi:unnamed protein product [Amoebophrya sp. A120]|nr:unnamed protein product [Amoebophrya sp. A120]|eukprot:GSA120T00008709001.1
MAPSMKSLLKKMAAFVVVGTQLSPLPTVDGVEVLLLDKMRKKKTSMKTASKVTEQGVGDLFSAGLNAMQAHCALSADCLELYQRECCGCKYASNCPQIEAHYKTVSNGAAPVCRSCGCAR